MIGTEHILTIDAPGIKKSDKISAFFILFFSVSVPHFAVQNFFDIGLLVQTILQGVTLLLFCFILVTTIRKPKVRYSILDWLILFFALLNILNSRETYRLNETSGVILTSTLYYFSLVVLQARIERKQLLAYLNRCILVAMLIQVILVLLQLIGKVANPNYLFEVGGAFGHPGYTFGVLSLGILIVVSNKVFYEQSRFFQTLFLLCAILTLTFAIITVSRTAIIVASLTPWIVFKKSYGKTTTPVSTSKKRILSLVVIISLLGLGYLKLDSLKGRLFIWKNVVTLVSQKPLMGYGSGSFTNTYNEYQIEYFKSGAGNAFEKGAADFVILAYNDFLETGLELGFLGLGVLVVIFTLLSKQLYEDPERKEFLLPLIGFVFFMSTWGIFHEDVYCNLLFIVFAFCRKD